MLGNDKDCDIYEGYDLFSAEPPDTRHRRPVLIAENPAEQRIYEYFTPVEIGRHRTLADYYNLNPTMLLRPGASLPTNIGQPTAMGTMLGTGDLSGHLTFGPYWRVSAGSYRLELKYRYDPGEESDAPEHTVAYLDVVVGRTADTTLRKQPLTPSPPNSDEFITEEFTIELEQPYDNLQLRTYFGGRGELEIGHVKITKLGATSDSSLTQ